MAVLLLGSMAFASSSKLFEHAVVTSAVAANSGKKRFFILVIVF
jgi:hypothetical protein